MINTNKKRNPELNYVQGKAGLSSASRYSDTAWLITSLRRLPVILQYTLSIALVSTGRTKVKAFVGRPRGRPLDFPSLFFITHLERDYILNAQLYANLKIAPVKGSDF